MTEKDLSVALLLDAAARATDPLTRFVDSLSDDEPARLRSFARETIRMRDELVHHVQTLLISESPHEAAAHAEWITRHAHEVAFRWGSLRRAATRAALYEPSPFRVLR